MIFTTKRYAEPGLRSHARSVADKRKGIYVARGKKTIADLVDFAAKLGQDRLTIFGGSVKGTVSGEVIVVLPGGRWRWD